MKYLITIFVLMLAMSAFASTNDVKALDILSKTLYHEARGEAERGIRAVASTIVNRAMKKDKNSSAENLVKQALKRKQYSCWNGKTDLSSGKGKAWEICREVAYEMVKGEFKTTSKHTHYYAHKIVHPYWAAGLENEVIGNHTFLTVRW